MSEEALRGFLERMLTDASLRGEVSAAVAAIAAERGFDCTAADCDRLFGAAAGTLDGELSDDALSGVAGGAGAPVIGHSISLAFSQQSDGLGRKFTGEH